MDAAFDAAVAAAVAASSDMNIDPAAFVPAADPYAQLCDMLAPPAVANFRALQLQRSPSKSARAVRRASATPAPASAPPTTAPQPSTSTSAWPVSWPSTSTTAATTTTTTTTTAAAASAPPAPSAFSVMDASSEPIMPQQMPFDSAWTAYESYCAPFTAMPMSMSMAPPMQLDTQTSVPNADLYGFYPHPLAFPNGGLSFDPNLALDFNSAFSAGPNRDVSLQDGVSVYNCRRSGTCANDAVPGPHTPPPLLADDSTDDDGDLVGLGLYADVGDDGDGHNDYHDYPYCGPDTGGGIGYGLDLPGGPGMRKSLTLEEAFDPSAGRTETTRSEIGSGMLMRMEEGIAGMGMQAVGRGEPGGGVDTQMSVDGCSMMMAADVQLYGYPGYGWM